eukprot:scaffold214478_cov31-Attheya_sp.AAC.1
MGGLLRHSRHPSSNRPVLWMMVYPRRAKRGADMVHPLPQLQMLHPHGAARTTLQLEWVDSNRWPCEGRDLSKTDEWVLDAANVNLRRGCNEEFAKRVVDGVINGEDICGILVEPVGLNDLCGCGERCVRDGPWMNWREKRYSCDHQIFGGREHKGEMTVNVSTFG